MNTTKVPDWAAGLMSSGYDIMVAGIEADLTKRGLPFEWQGDSVEVSVPEHGKIKIGTSDLVRAMIHGAPEQWRDIISTHMTTIDATLLIIADDTTLDRVRPNLRIAIVSERQHVDGAVDRVAAPGLRMAVVIDQPKTIITVTHDMINKWGASSDELFGIAIPNTEAMPMMAEVREINGVRIEVVHNDTCYAAAMGILSLPKLVTNAKLGALVGIPDRDNVAFHQVVDVRSIAASQIIVAMTVSTFVRSPYAMSETPYWWHNGVFEQFARVPVEDNFALIPPRGLLTILGVSDMSPVNMMAPKAPGAGKLIN